VTVYELKVTINNIELLIWRTFQVPGGITLARLHEVLQIVMGWGEGHLYEFRSGKNRFGVPTTEEGRFRRENVHDTRIVRLLEVLRLEGQKITYIYDFGDDWQHTIEVVKIVTVDSEFENCLCTGGQRACPPENCGSYPGYITLVEELKLPTDQRDADLMEWLEEGYDPQLFDIAEVNRQLKRLKVS